MEHPNPATDQQTEPLPPAPAAQAAISWLEDHGEYLFSYAFARVGRIEVAEDLLQETLLAAIGSHDRFEERASVRTWLTSILRHKMVDHLRRQTRDGRDVREPAAQKSGDDDALERFADSQFSKGGKWRTNPGRWGRSPAEEVESEELHQVLLDCLDKLPPRSAEAIDLVERCGMNLQEISNVLGVSTTNIGVILHRARLALRKCLEENWFREP